MAIHWRLGKVLDAKGMTPLQLARALGVAHPSIYRLAAQTTITRITADMLDRLCTALDCDPCDLMEHEPPPNPAKKRRAK